MSTTPDQVRSGSDASLPATRREVPVSRWRDGVIEQAPDQVAEEVPVSLVYQGIPHVVMLTTPSDLEDLGVGFTVSEAIVARAEEIRSVQAGRNGDALEVRIGITAERFSALLGRQRNLTGRTGCGLCGVVTVEEAIRSPAPVGEGVRVTVAELHAALKELGGRQPINTYTGSVHAAAWAIPGKGIQVVREDVGRHNALDKVLGAVLRARLDPQAGYLLITSRASFEMVQKSATLGVTVLAAVSAPTALAIRLAEASDMTLIGFAREHQHVVYAGARRLVS